MVLLLCYPRLQLEVSRWIVPAAWRIGLQKLQKSYCSCEAAQSRSSPDKWLLREEVAGRRGASAKKCEEVRQRRSNPAKKSSSLINPSMHPTHPSIHSFIRWVTDSLIDWRKFRSQTSDNMDRWEEEMGRVREKRREKIREEKTSEERRCKCAKR